MADFYKKKKTPKNLFLPLCHDTGYRYFYSRTRKGCDHKEWLRVLALISTHTPVKGVTLQENINFALFLISTMQFHQKILRIRIHF